MTTLRYTTNGKQLLLDGLHLADVRSERAAGLLAVILNSRERDLAPGQRFPHDAHGQRGQSPCTKTPDVREKPDT